MHRRHLVIALLCAILIASSAQAQDLWDLANRNKEVLRIATLFTAQDVRGRLSNDEGIDSAIAWCKQTGVTHAFIESFRDGYTAQRQALEHARDRFRSAGFDVSGCVTTTGVGKKSTGWESATCFTDAPTQKRLQEIFEYAASLFEEIMIDDFLFTDCQCDECRQARGDLSWSAYRAKLMIGVSRERIVAPARAVNPNVKIIIKYPQWYDDFHNRGYEVVEQTADYDRIWVGTETRDYADPRWGGKVQYETYFIMRWLGEIGGSKCGGGWFDPYGTHEDTYVEQARQTVLAGAKEMLLFCYGSLLRDTGPANVARLRTEIPGLFELARLVRNKPPRGIAAPKPPDSDALGEAYVYDFVGMLGLPLVPTATIDTDAKAAFLPAHALKDPQLQSKLAVLLEAGAPVLVTDGLAQRPTTSATNDLLVLKVSRDPKRLLELPREDLKLIRDKMLSPFGMQFDAPNKTALYLIGDDCVVVENFNDTAVTASLEFAQPVEAKAALVLPVDGDAELSSTPGKVEFRALGARTLVALTLSGRNEGQ
ncbi:MAG: hypothetical protein JW993_10740 [Sedimentisphaerales bacterium]|nr:hypothetical protein [Sedimentisphaerales bacterium]